MNLTTTDQDTIARLKSERDALQQTIYCAEKKINDLESDMASITDLLNTWAREKGVKQAESWASSEIKMLIDRLWTMGAVVEAEKHVASNRLLRANKALGSTDDVSVKYA